MRATAVWLRVVGDEAAPASVAPRPTAPRKRKVAAPNLRVVESPARPPTAAEPASAADLLGNG